MMRASYLIILCVFLMTSACEKKSEKKATNTSGSSSGPNGNIALQLQQGVWMDNYVPVRGNLNELRGAAFDFNSNGTVRIGYWYDYTVVNALYSDFLPAVREDIEVKFYHQSTWSVEQDSLLVIEEYSTRPWRIPSLSLLSDSTARYNASGVIIANQNDTLRRVSLDDIGRVSDLMGHQLGNGDLSGIWLRGQPNFTGEAFELSGGLVYRFLNYDPNNIQAGFTEIPKSTHGVSNWRFFFSAGTSNPFDTYINTSFFNEAGTGILEGPFARVNHLNDFSIDQNGALNYFSVDGQEYVKYQ